MATSSYFGRNSFVGAALEDSGWGTAEMTPDVTRPIISCSMLRQVEKVERANLRVAGVAGLRKGHIIVSDKVTGALELESTYDNGGFWLHHALGASATSGPTADGIYTHTYTMGDVPVGGITLRLQRGTSDYSETFEGTVISALTLSCAAGEAMTCSMDLLAETSNDTEGARGDTTLTFTEPTHENLVLHNHAGDLNWNGQTFNLIDFEYKLENGIAERMRLGSLLTKQPVQSDYRTVTMTVTIETDDVQGYQQFVADTVGDAVIEFYNDGSTSSARYLTFRANACYIDSYTDEVSETGLITASITFKAQGDGTSALALGTEIEVRNAASTAIHNG